MDLLNGSIWDKLLIFALPLAATGILQQLFNAADVAVVGQFAGKNAMAAVGSNASLISLLVNSFTGISMGANVVISRCIGKKDPAGIRKGVHTSLAFALISGIVMCFAGQIFVTWILKRMSVPAEILPLSVLYMRIYFSGLPVIILYNFLSAIFRSQGDTRTPLVVLTASGVINIFLNLFFVCVMHMSVAGVAIATVASNAFSACVLFVLLLRHPGDFRVRREDFGIHREALVQILRIGVPAAVQSMVFSFSNIIIQSAVNSLGPDVMAASSAAFNIEIFCYFVINSFGQACTTFVGQNYGAGRLDRCRKVTRIGLLMDLAVCAAVSFSILAAGRPLLGIFNGDETVISLGLIRLRYILSGELINVVMEIMSGSMRGYGYSLVPAVLTLFGVCGVRISWVAFVFSRIGSYGSLMACYPLSWAVSALALTAAYIRFIRHLGRDSALRSSL
jgi:putative MATE family efflux protein